MEIQLLMRPALLALLATSMLGCSVGPVWSPRVAGRIVDKETGEPVVGALVSATYGMHSALKWEGGSYVCCYKTSSTFTDAEGRFEIPGGFELMRPLPFTWVEVHPDVEWLHPAYGLGLLSRDAKVDWSHLELSMVRDEQRIELYDASDGVPFCLGSHSCWEACQLWFGDDQECVRRGLHAPGQARK